MAGTIASRAVVAVFAVFLLAELGRCDPDSFDLLGLCGQTQHVTSSDLVTARGDSYSGTGEDCQVKFVSAQSSAPASNHIRVQVLSVDTDCRRMKIYLRDASGSFRSNEICGGSWSPVMYEITSDTLIVDVWIVRGYFSRDMEVSLLVTSYSDEYTSGDFRCDNYDYIDGKLHCDGYNNCGDNSDEKFCHALTWPWTIVLISGACVLGVVIVTVIIALIRRRNRRPQNSTTTSDQQQVVTPVKQTRVPGLPSYGSIPGSGYQPYSSSSPPPYTPVDTHVTMPPPPASPEGSEPATSAGQDADGARAIN